MNCDQTKLDCCCCVRCGINCTCPKCALIHVEYPKKLEETWNEIVEEAQSRLSLFKSRVVNTDPAEAKKNFICSELSGFSKEITKEGKYFNMGYCLGPSENRTTVCKTAYCEAYSTSERTLDRIISGIKDGQVIFQRPINERTYLSENWLKTEERYLANNNILISAVQKGIIRSKTSGTEEFAAAWLNDWVSLNGEWQPNSQSEDEIQIGHIEIQSIWKEYSTVMRDHKERFLNLGAFYKMWRKSFPHLKMRVKKNVGGKCIICADISVLRQTAKRPTERAQLSTLQYLHSLLYMSERRSYYERRVEATRSCNSIMSTISDGMAQAHCQLPWFGNKLSSAEALDLHLQGVLEHGKEFVAYLTYDNVKTGANLAIHTMLLQWEAAYNRSAKNPNERFMPDTLYHQIDGGSENVNKTTLAICELMVATKMVRKIVLTRLPPGHTHEDIDARFGVLWRTMYHTQINSPPDYKRSITEAFKKSREQDLDVRIIEIFAVPDYTEYFSSQECIDPFFERYSKQKNAQLQFIFENCKESENFPLGVKTTYRAYSSDSVVELWNKNEIPWAGGIEPADIVGLVPVRVAVKAYPTDGMSLLLKLPDGLPKVASFAPNHMENIAKVLRFVNTRFQYSSSAKVLSEWNHWTNGRYPSKLEAEEYVSEHPLHIPFKYFLFDRQSRSGVSGYSNSRPIAVSMFDKHSLICAESQPSVLHKNQRDKSVASRILTADDRLESCTVVNAVKRPRNSLESDGVKLFCAKKKQRILKYSVGQRVDFKKPKCQTWIAGRVISIDEHFRYNVVDGNDKPTDGLLTDRLREAELYNVNDPVYAKYKSYKNVYPGVISAVNNDFTYDIIFTDKDIAVNVTVDLIEPRDIIST